MTEGNCMSDTAAGLALSEELSQRINSAFTDGLPMLIAYVNTEGQARLSFRGSLHAHSADQLAFWARDPEGGATKALEANPKMTVMFRDPATRTTIFFYGRGHVENDQATRDRVYDESPEAERNADAEKKGHPVIIDLDTVQGRTPDGPINLSRG
jgi:hypothetical protein